MLLAAIHDVSANKWLFDVPESVVSAVTAGLIVAIGQGFGCTDPRLASLAGGAVDDRVLRSCPAPCTQCRATAFRPGWTGGDRPRRAPVGFHELVDWIFLTRARELSRGRRQEVASDVHRSDWPEISLRSPQTPFEYPSGLGRPIRRLVGDLAMASAPQEAPTTRLTMAFDLLDKAEALLGYGKSESGADDPRCPSRAGAPSS